jgi:hypothetical protein
MPEEVKNFENAAKLAETLSEILVSGSLYRNFVYTGRNCHLTTTSALSASRYGALPKRIRMFCNYEKCAAATWWEIDDADCYFKSSLINEKHYICRNCGVNVQYYQLIWQENRSSNVFIKVGQWPPLSIEPLPELAQAVGGEDLKLYRKGLIDFKFGHGVGAVGYFRRVLENKVNALLDLLVEAAKNAQVPDAHLSEVETTKQSHRVEDKIDLAVKILPAPLKTGGHNPLDKLYRPLSAGLHGESDEECLTIFSEARFVFEYLFKNLTESNEEARRYVTELSAGAKGIIGAAKKSPPEPASK